MKFKLFEMLVVVSVTAFAIASLVQGNRPAELLFTNFTYLAILAALPSAVGRSGGSRAFWLGFLLTGILYLSFSTTPDQNGNSPRTDGLEFTSQLSIYFFDKLKQWHFEEEDEDQNPFANPNPFADANWQEQDGKLIDASSSSNADDQIAEDGANPIAAFGSGEDFDSLLELVRETIDDDCWTVEEQDGGTIKPYASSSSSGCFITPTDQLDFISFMAISHCVWALLLAWIVGHVSRFVFELSNKETK